MSAAFAARAEGSEARAIQARRYGRLARESHNLTKVQALTLAQHLLAAILADGVDYADFQAAQHAERSIRAALRSLNHVS